jgi:Myosin tail
VKPLLQVTNNEEKFNAKAQELRQVVENLDKLKTEHDTLAAEHLQTVNEKTVLAEQLRAEQELCAETEEVCAF